MPSQSPQDLANALMAQAQEDAIEAAAEHQQAVEGWTADDLVDHLGRELDSVDIIYDGLDLAAQTLTMADAMLISGLTRVRNAVVDARAWLEAQTGEGDTVPLKAAAKLKAARVRPAVISDDEDL